MFSVLPSCDRAAQTEATRVYIEFNDRYCLLCIKNTNITQEEKKS